MQINNITNNIVTMQRANPELLLCGSIALILAGVMPPREIGDFDFAINRKHFSSLQNFTHFSQDAYPTNVDDNYMSYHGYWKSRPFICGINLLVFDNEITLQHEVVTYKGQQFLIQKADDILYWKKQYNRDKDIKDLNVIATKAVEDFLLS